MLSSGRKLPVCDLPRRLPGGRLRLLGGIRVLDLTTSIAGPYATMILADLGADIIKVERPGIGDDSRHWKPPALGDRGLWYSSVNRNKRSITLDFTSEEGRKILLDLVRISDVVITTQVARVQEKLDITYEAMRSVRPDVVYVSLTGFGVDGTRANRLCYDLVAEGYSGVMDLTGEAENDPQKIGTPAADLLAGSDAALGCIAALFDRAVRGEGHFVDVSLVESMTRFMTPRLVSYLGSGELPGRTGAKDSIIAIYQTFLTADEPMTLAVPNDNIWKRFCKAIDREKWISDENLSDNAARVTHRRQLIADIAGLLKQRGRDYWLALFERVGVPAGPINRLDEVSSDPELQRRGLFYSISDGATLLPQVGLGIRFDQCSAGYEIPPPHLGQHTNEVLKELLDLNDEQIMSLRAREII